MTAASRLTINAGSCCGNMYVTFGGSTIFNGGHHPSDGSFVVATGGGQLGGTLTARYITSYSSAPSSVTVTGHIVAARPYGFDLRVGSASVPIVLDSKSVLGGALGVGTTATVKGLGTAATAIVAVQVATTMTAPSGPTPAPISQKHVLTADYLGGQYGTHSISWSAAAPYLTWAQTDQYTANAIAAQGIKTQLYADPNQLAANDSMMTAAHGSIVATTCGGNRVTTNWKGTTMYVTNPSSSAMQSDYAQYVRSHVAGVHVDAIFQDATGALEDFGSSIFSGMPCGYSTSNWLNAEEQLSRSARVPIIFNGPMGQVTPTQSTHAMTLLASSAFIGGDFEHCYSDMQQPEMAGWGWQAIENAELTAAAMHKILECMPRNTNSAAGSGVARIYTLASFLLTYDPSTSVLGDQFGTRSGFHVEPEEMLVPLSPRVSSPQNVGALQKQGGAYGREYARCFMRGTYVGPCAVVVNSSTNASAVFPYPQYRHTLVVSGSGVLDGGSVRTDGPPPPLYLAPHSAAIVF
jgi:hypothetical protein